MRVLVTGARGFLGRHVVEALGAAHAVESGRARPSGRSTDRIVTLDLDAPHDMADALRTARCSAIVHCAAYGLRSTERDPGQAVRTNVTGTLALWEAARCQGIRRFLHVGTCFELGSSPTPQDEEACHRPVGVYGATKSTATKRLIERACADPYAPVILRPFALFGHDVAEGRLVSDLSRALRTRRPLAMSRGAEVRDYVQVEFVAEAIARLAVLDEAHFPFGRTFNLCTGDARTVRAFAESLANELEIASLLRFGERPSRDDVPQSVIGDPRRWQTFASSLPTANLPARPPPFSDAISRLARRIREGRGHP